MSDPVRDALAELVDVVTAQNCAGTDWGPRFGALMTALGKSRAALAAQPAEPVADWRMVPADPTDAMVDATHHGQPVADIYRDMIAAAPAAPQGE